MYTDFHHLFTVTRRNVWRIKVKLRLPPHLYSVTTYLAKHTLLLIWKLHFRMCNILKFTQNILVVLIPYLLIYSQQCLMTTLLRHNAFMHNVFCFNGFNQTAIVLRYSVHIKPRKTIKRFMRHTFLAVTAKKWLKSVYNYRSYLKIRT